MLLSVDLVNDDNLACPLTDDELCDTCQMVLVEEGVNRPCFLSLTVLAEDQMRERNLAWRGVDSSTDVLSLECERPDDPDLAEGEPCELGDILIAPAFIERQAHAYGTTPADEMRLMLIHGMLHLLGYDHLEETEALAMEAREDELLAKAGASVPAGHVALTRHRGGEGA